MKYYLTIQAYEKESSTEVHCFIFAFPFCPIHWRAEAQTGKEKQLTMEFKNEGTTLYFLNVLKKYRGIKFFLFTMKLVLILLPEK